ncbi:hypothetical protein ACIPRI_04820 [Variovorax sp. LARHSF232]
MGVGALALIPSGAHLAALPNKIGLGEPIVFVALCLVAVSVLSWRQA